jgi:hypothetical protein
MTGYSIDVQLLNSLLLSNSGLSQNQGFKWPSHSKPDIFVWFSDAIWNQNLGTLSHF